MLLSSDRKKDCEDEAGGGPHTALFLSNGNNIHINMNNIVNQNNNNNNSNAKKAAIPLQSVMERLIVRPYRSVEGNKSAKEQSMN